MFSHDKTSGKYVTLQHGRYIVSYCHLSKILAVKGTMVRPRDVVGITGSTGRSTGEHLHITCKMDGRSVNPSVMLEMNKERCRRMERLGLMTDAGQAVLPDMSENGFVIDKDILKSLQNDPVVWDNFCSFPDLYKRVRIDTIQIKKRQPELYKSRLDKFIENTRKGILYGEWNDNGRLLG